MKSIFIALVALLMIMQYRLWFGQGGLMTIAHIREEIMVQELENKSLKERNLTLVADIDDLKNGNEAAEERARNDLGMVKHDESFYQIVSEG